jgi:hypothetical protein
VVEEYESDDRSEFKRKPNQLLRSVAKVIPEATMRKIADNQLFAVSACKVPILFFVVSQLGWCNEHYHMLSDVYV